MTMLPLRPKGLCRWSAGPWKWDYPPADKLILVLSTLKMGKGSVEDEAFSRIASQAEELRELAEAVGHACLVPASAWD